MVAKAFWLATLAASQDSQSLRTSGSLFQMWSGETLGPWPVQTLINHPDHAQGTIKKGNVVLTALIVLHSMRKTSPNNPSADFLGLATDNNRRGPGLLVLTTAISYREPQVDVTVPGRSISFFLDTRTIYLVLKEF